MVFHPDLIDPLCQAALDRFQAMIPSMYRPEDVERGYLQLADRRGQPQRYGLVSMAIGVTTNVHRRFRDHREVVQVATEMKTHVKHAHVGTSAYAVDGRSS